jgi:hypothetical protein
MKTPRIHDFDPEAAERQLGTPLDGMPTIQKPAVVNRASPAVSERSKPSLIDASVQTQKLPSTLASEPRVKTQEFEKYSTFIRSAHKKTLKILALENDCNDYEVLDEALAAYFDSHKK